MLLWHYLLMFFIIIISSFKLSFLIIKKNSKKQIQENKICRHDAREKPHSRGKPSQNSSFCRFKMRRPRPLQLRLETTSIKSFSFHYVCIPRSMSLNSFYWVCIEYLPLSFHWDIITAMSPCQFSYCSMLYQLLYPNSKLKLAIFLVTISLSIHQL